MKITTEEREIANELIEKFLKHKNSLPYANIGLENEYLGWVEDFHLIDHNNNKLKLDLNDNNDLFLLFVLAVVWSRTGPWENSAYFVSYLKINKKDTIDFWTNKSNIEKEEENREQSAIKISDQLKGINPRKKISFRKDIFFSIHLLAKNWSQILDKLDESEKANNFEIFMEFIRSINGLGVGQKKILIKIPLILRELRCQKIYSNISGELCCVPDARVNEAGKSLNIKIPVTSNLDNLKKSSAKIFRLFGNLYDLPLFAYEDLKNI